jgi:hypothetical protein
VTPSLHHPAPLQHQDLIGVTDGAEAMGYQDLGAGAATQRFVYPSFGFGTEGAGGFIENQNREAQKQHLGQLQALTLAVGEVPRPHWANIVLRPAGIAVIMSNSWASSKADQS